MKILALAEQLCIRIPLIKLCTTTLLQLIIFLPLYDLGQDDSYDFGSGAGFYVNATEEPWAKNYQMYDYVTKELPELINDLFPVDTNRKSICGHSMGGHGALICHFKNPGIYSSVRMIF